MERSLKDNILVQTLQCRRSTLRKIWLVRTWEELPIIYNTEKLRKHENLTEAGADV